MVASHKGSSWKKKKKKDAVTPVPRRDCVETSKEKKNGWKKNKESIRITIQNIEQPPLCPEGVGVWWGEGAWFFFFFFFICFFFFSFVRREASTRRWRWPENADIRVT